MALTTAQIQNAYVAFFNRPADVAGLNYWMGYNGSIADLFNAFAGSQECKSLFTGQNSTQIVNTVYQNLFGRSPDVPGLTYWVGELDSGKVTVANIANAVNFGAQGTDKTIIDNKVTAATSFTSALDTTAEIVGYAQASSATLSQVKTWLSAVTDQASSLTAANDTLLALTTTVASGNVTIPGGSTGGGAGQAFSLTASADSVNEGTANVFTVTASKAVTEATTVTFQLKIDAAGDTAQAADFNAGSFNPVTVTIPAGSTTATFNMAAITNDGTELSEKYTVQATVGTTVLTKQVTILDGAIGAGQNFVLTKDLDVLPSMNGSNGNSVTSGNDTVIGIVTLNASGTVDTTATFNNFDMINAGEGTDTLKLSISGGNTGSGYTVDLSNIENVETVELQSTAISSGLTVNTSAVTGVTNLNITKAASAVAATAAATTDVSVTLKENGATSKLAHTVAGGKNVTVTATEMGTTAASGDSFSIGSGNAPKGDVVVNLTGAKYAGSSAAFGSGDTVVINGGKTVSVTQVASSDSSFAATSTGNSGSGVTQADVKVTATADTTTINVKQDVATAKNASATTGGVTETATVKFGALKAGNTLNLDVDGTSTGNSGITLTAKEDMTAADVAQAFANLVAKSNHLNASGTAVLADGDTQGSIAYTKATYALDTSNSGSSTSLWSSAAASGDTVVFTAATANTNVTDIAFTASGSGSNAPVVTTTQGKGHDATFTGGVMGAIAGKVTIDGSSGAALKTVTIDGFGAGSSGSGTTALETLNLSNSAGNAFTVGNAAATLNLNLEKVTDASGSTGVTISSGAATLNVKSVGNNVLTNAAATTALNVAGNGTLTLGSGSSIKTIVVNETAGLTSSSSLTALESVNTTATTGTVTINIGSGATYTGGAGVDNVTVANAAGTGIGKAIDLGAGNDTLTLNGTGTTTPTVDIKGGEGVDTLSMTAGTAAALGAAFAAKVSGFERLTLNDQVATSGDVTVNLKTLGFANYVTTNGYNDAATTGKLILDNLADNATVVLAGNQTGSGSGAIEAKIEGASGSTTNVLNVIGTTATGNLTAGKLVANEVETINLTATDTAPTNASGAADIQTITLALAADKATAVNLGTSNANLTLTLDSTTNKLATVDGNAMTGNLTVNLTAHNGVAMTVKGGAGADVLSASAGANAKADVLNGGAGNDVLYAGTNGAKLTGGAGNDLFVVMDSAASGSAFNGNKQVNTYSTIEDFQAGDVLQLLWNVGSGGNATGADAVVNSFVKLTATLDAGTSVFTDYVSAAMQQAAATSTGTAGDAVWFKVGSDSYVVIDNGVETTGAFVNGEDLIVKLTGVDLTSASFNTTYGTVTL